MSERHRIVTENPFAAALSYERLINAVLECLIGLRPSHRSKKSNPIINDRKVGLFGVPLAYVGVTEAQSKGAAHFHFVLWCDGSPAYIQRHITDPARMAALAARIDSMVTAALTENAQHAAENKTSLPVEEPTLIYRDHRVPVPCPSVSPAEFKAFAEAVAWSSNRHTHTFTCRKGENGKYACRLAYERATWNRPTEFVQLKRVSENGERLKVAARKNFETNAPHGRDMFFNTNENQLVVLELHRPANRQPAPFTEPSDTVGGDTASAAEAETAAAAPLPMCVYTASAAEAQTAVAAPIPMCAQPTQSMDTCDQAGVQTAEAAVSSQSIVLQLCPPANREAVPMHALSSDTADGDTASAAEAQTAVAAPIPMCVQSTQPMDTCAQAGVQTAEPAVPRRPVGPSSTSAPAPQHSSAQSVAERTTTVNTGAEDVYRDEATGSNGMVVSFSPCLSAALRCNTDVSPLGNVVQAMSAGFYLLKYITKTDGHVLSTHT